MTHAKVQLAVYGAHVMVDLEHKPLEMVRAGDH